MRVLSLDDFVDIYLSSVLKSIPKDGLRSLDDFYNSVFQDVSKRTGFSTEQIKYLHHAFHWSLFLRNESPLKIGYLEKNDGDYKIGLRNGSIRKDEQVSRVLAENNVWLESRLKKLNSP